MLFRSTENDLEEIIQESTPINESEIKKEKENRIIIKEIEVSVYQTTLNEELIQSFYRLINFKPLPKEVLENRSISLDSKHIRRKTLIVDIDGTLGFSKCLVDESEKKSNQTPLCCESQLYHHIDKKNAIRYFPKTVQPFS